MNRQSVLKKAFQRGHLLNLRNRYYKDWVENFIIEETKGDIGSGDITSNSVIMDNQTATAVVYTRDPGILAGIEEASFLYNHHGIKTKILKRDASTIKKGDKLMILKGGEKELLEIERSGLDIIQRMSGIATLTSSLIKKINNRIKIAPTRKTQWRYLDKKAVYLGKGLTHRLALWESILIKDNHLSALSRQGIKDPIVTALERAQKHQKKANFIEIEVQTREQAIKAAETFKRLKIKIPRLIMLDNMSPDKIKQTIRELKKKQLYDQALIEVSGGIEPKNIVAYSKTGADVISLGYLTKAPRSLDIKQEIIR